MPFGENSLALLPDASQRQAVLVESAALDENVARECQEKSPKLFLVLEYGQIVLVLGMTRTI